MGCIVFWHLGCWIVDFLWKGFSTGNPMVKNTIDGDKILDLF